MGFKISVPAIGDHASKVSWCNVSTETEAISLTEAAIGYRVSGIAYVLDECDSEWLAEVGVETGRVRIEEQ